MALSARLAIAIWLGLWPVSALAQAASSDAERVANAPQESGAAAQDAAAQSSTGDNDAGQPSPPEPAPPAPDNARMFGVLPNYATVDDPAAAQPITAKQKLKLAELGAFDPIVYPFAAFSASLNRQFGPGAGGYGKQYAASLADTITGNIMTTGVMPSLFHQDPRYFRKRVGGGWSRAGYAATRVFVGRTDGGRHIFNVAEFAGVAAATAISNLYYPQNSHTMSGAATRMGFQLMWDSVSSELKEFWPNVRDWMRRRKARKP